MRWARSRSTSPASTSAGRGASASRRRAIPNTRYAGAIADELCELGRFGQKPAPAGIASEGKKSLDPAVVRVDRNRAGAQGSPRAASSRRHDPAAGARGDRQRRRQGAQRRDRSPRARHRRRVDRSVTAIRPGAADRCSRPTRSGFSKILADVEVQANAFAGAGYEPAPRRRSLSPATAGASPISRPARRRERVRGVRRAMENGRI